MRLSSWAAVVATFLILTFARTPVAETARESGQIRIHILTMGPGDELFARFGHIAILVEDREARTKKVYNFGTFDFDDPDLKIKYAKGFLGFWLAVRSYSRIVRLYRAYDREMVVRTLNLTDEQAAKVNRRLEINALPENRIYAYRHYLDNCCTRVRDVIEDATGGALSKGRNTAPTGRTFRDWTAKALARMPVLGTAILFSLGPAIDRPITRYDEQFLPEVVAEDLDNTLIGPKRRPLVARKRTVIDRVAPPVDSKIPQWELALSIGFMVLLAIGFLLPTVLKRRPIGARLLGIGLFVWGLVAGLGGLALILFWTATAHSDTYYNENLLVFPVLHLWLLGPGIRLLFTGRIKERTKRILEYYLLATSGVILLDVVLKIGPFIQGNWGFIAFAAACNLLALGALKRTGTMPALDSH